MQQSKAPVSDVYKLRKFQTQKESQEGSQSNTQNKSRCKINKFEQSDTAYLLNTTTCIIFIQTELRHVNAHALHNKTEKDLPIQKEFPLPK